MKAIKEILKSDYFSKNKFLKDTLKEARFCYCNGANMASQVLSVSFIEKLLKLEFPNEFSDGMSLNVFLKNNEGNIFEDPSQVEIVHKQRKERNQNLHKNRYFFQILYGYEVEKEINYSSKNAKEALMLIKDNFERIINRTNR